MVKFYIYLVYRLYDYWNNGNRLETPVGNIIIVLSLVHLVQLFTIFCLLLKYFNSLDFIFRIKPPIIILSILLFGILHYFIFYNKKKWESYNTEFQNESNKTRKIGSIIIITYIFGSFVLFFTLIPILFRK